MTLASVALSSYSALPPVPYPSISSRPMLCLRVYPLSYTNIALST